MAKKWIGGLLALLLLAAAAAYWYLARQSYELRITQAQLEQKLADKLPLTRGYPLLSVTLANPRVRLNEQSERIDFGLDVTMALSSGAVRPPIRSEVDISAGIRYDPQQGAFFLTDPVVDRLRLDGVNDRFMTTLNVVLSNAIAAFFAERPVYTLSSADPKQRLAQMVVKRVAVEKGEIVVVMGL